MTRIEKLNRPSELGGFLAGANSFAQTTGSEGNRDHAGTKTPLMARRSDGRQYPPVYDECILLSCPALFDLNHP
jgi:hypothetical protein